MQIEAEERRLMEEQLSIERDNFSDNSNEDTYSNNDNNNDNDMDENPDYAFDDNSSSNDLTSFAIPPISITSSDDQLLLSDDYLQLPPPPPPADGDVDAELTELDNMLTEVINMV